MDNTEQTEPKKRTMKAFNAKLQVVEDHVVTVDANGEYVFTGSDGSFFKISGNATKEEIIRIVAAHEEANKGQIPHDTIEEAKKNEAKLDALFSE